MLKAMKAQAKELHVPKVGYSGYITFDEMSVQVLSIAIMPLLSNTFSSCSTRLTGNALVLLSAENV
jgi:selenophosphate synthetase-related protein